MIRKIASPLCEHVRVTFELPSCIWADRIFVAGDFNNWDFAATPMRQDRDGIWRAALDLPAGKRYEFRYLVDGKWHTDYHADGSRSNSFGSENSVVDTGVLTMEPTRELGMGSLLHEALPAVVAAQSHRPPVRPALRAA